MRTFDLIAYILLGLVVIVPTFLLLSHGLSDGVSTAIWAVLPIVVIIAIAMLVDNEEKDTGDVPLRKFITKAMHRGHSVNEIQQALVGSGWPAGIVERALAQKGALVQTTDVKTAMDDPFDPLREFISSMAKHGASALMIRDKLINAGWNPDVIDPIITEMLRRKEDKAVVQTILWFGKQNI